MSQQEKPVEIWYTRCGGATASTVAIQKNWLHEEFAEEGVSLASIRDNPGNDVRESHYDHSITAMFREGGNIPPIWTKAKGTDTVTLAITWVDEFQRIVVRADSPINDIADLKGKRLAVPLYDGITIDFQRGAALHGYANALGLAGLGRDDVTFVDYVREGRRGAFDPAGQVSRPNGAPELDALKAGEVDAVFLRQGGGLKLFKENEAGLKTISDLSLHPDPLRRVNNGTPRPVTVHRDFLKAHPDLVVRYLTVLLRAAAWAEANPADAVKLIAAEDGARVSEALIAEAYPRLAVSLTPKLTAEYVAGLEAQKNFLRDWGFLAGDFDINDWIVREPLEEALRIVAGEVRAAA